MKSADTATVGSTYAARIRGAFAIASTASATRKTFHGTKAEAQKELRRPVSVSRQG